MDPEVFLVVRDGPVPDEDRLVVHDQELEGVDFSRRHFRHPTIAGSRLVRCDFSRSRITNGGLGGGYESTEYVDCVFDGCSLTKVIPGRATFLRCSFRDVKIRDVRFQDAQLIDCVFTGSLRMVTFSAKPWSFERLDRTRNVYRGNDFSGARLEDVTFRGGIDLDQQRLPEGVDHFVVRDAAAVLSRIWDKVQQWPEDDLRMDAEVKLQILSEDCESGQCDLFVSRSFLGLRSPVTAERLTALLTGAA